MQSPEAQGADRGTPPEWAEQTHAAGRQVWEQMPGNHVLDDRYYQAVQPVLDRQLGLAGLRLARFLNEAYGAKECR